MAEDDGGGPFLRRDPESRFADLSDLRLSTRQDEYVLVYRLDAVQTQKDGWQYRVERTRIDHHLNPAKVLLLYRVRDLCRYAELTHSGRQDIIKRGLAVRRTDVLRGDGEGGSTARRAHGRLPPLLGGEIVMDRLAMLEELRKELETRLREARADMDAVERLIALQERLPLDRPAVDPEEVAAAVRDILGLAGRPLHRNEILRQLGDRGIYIPGDKPVSNLSAIMSRADGIEPVAQKDGRWELHSSDASQGVKKGSISILPPR